MKFAVVIALATAGTCLAAETAKVNAANLEVVVEAKAPLTVCFAAEEMTNYLGQAFGREVPLVTSPTDGRYGLFLGDSAWSRAAGLDAATLKRDGYFLKIGKDRAFIVGRDNPRDDLRKCVANGGLPESERATLFGVYGFLESKVGFRFYFPGELGTVVPKLDALALPVGEETVEPRFFDARCCYMMACAYPGCKMESPEDRTKKTYYRLLMRDGTWGTPCCHGQNKFRIPQRFKDTNPEFFFMNEKGERYQGKDWAYDKLCHTSGAIDIVRKETLERIRKGEKCVDVMPNDGMVACHCEKCLKAYGTTNLTYQACFASELVWGYTADIARAITAAGLDGKVSQMAYGCYRRPPSFALPTNIEVVCAVGGPWAVGHPAILDKQVAFVREWSEKVGHPLAWIWTYPMKNYGRLETPFVPQVAPRAFAKFYTLTAPYINGSFIEADRAESLVQHYLNFYVFNRIAWDGKVDVDALLAEHHRLMFGAAAEPMAKFFDAIERKWIDEITPPSLIPETEIGDLIDAPSEYELWMKIYSREFFGTLNGWLREAAGAVPEDSLERKRIAWIRAELYTAPLKVASEYWKKSSIANERKFRESANLKPVVASGDWSDWTLQRWAQASGSVLDVDGPGFEYLMPVAYVELDGARALKPNTKYRLSCLVKTENLKNGYGCGACLEVDLRDNGKPVKTIGYPDYCKWRHTSDWHAQSYEFTTPENVSGKSYLKVSVWRSTGKAYFDSIRLDEVLP